MLPVTPSARQGPHRSNTGMIYVRCLSLHTACSSALELLVKPNHSSNLSPYMCRRWGLKVSEMKMTRPDLIVVSICGSRQDVCLNVCLFVHLSLFSLGAMFSMNGSRSPGCSHTIRALIWSSRSKEFTGDLFEPDSIIITTHNPMKILSPHFSGQVIGFMLHHNIHIQKNTPKRFFWEFCLWCLYLHDNSLKFTQHTVSDRTPQRHFPSSFLASLPIWQG